MECGPSGLLDLVQKAVGQELNPSRDHARTRLHYTMEMTALEMHRRVNLAMMPHVLVCFLHF